MPIAILPNGEVWDDSYDLLAEVAELLDSRLQGLTDEADQTGDPDAFGVTDRWEHTAGFGFVALQEYLTSTSVPGKREADLALGPMRGRHTLAQVVNAAANYWKHKAEWTDPPPDRARRTIEVMKGLGVDVHRDYPILRAFCRLCGDLPKRFATLLPGLAAWRDAVLERRGAQGR